MNLAEEINKLTLEVRGVRMRLEAAFPPDQPPASEVVEAVKVLKDASAGAWDRPEGEAELASRASESMPACPKCGTNANAVARCCGHWYAPPPSDGDAGATDTPVNPMQPPPSHNVGCAALRMPPKQCTCKPREAVATTCTDPERHGHATAKVDCSPDQLAAVRELCEAAHEMHKGYSRMNHNEQSSRRHNIYNAAVAVERILPTLRLLPPGHVAVPREVAIDGRDACAKARDAATHSGVAVEWDRSVSAFNNALSKETP